MRRLLQRVDDGRFYCGRDAWTSELQHACDFRDTPSAVACCFQENLPPVRLVLKFPNSDFDISVFINRVFRNRQETNGL
jgi:hypothetical protein